MAHSVVQAALQQEFDLPHPPAIVSFAERRLSLFYEFRMDGIEYFLKVRKLPAHREGDLAASAADPAVQREARAEWDALCWLFARTDSPDCAVAFVRPVAWIESLNGIVTERVHGEDLWRIVRDPILPRALRKLDLFEQIGRGLGFLAMRGCSDGAGDGGAAPGSSSTARLQPVQHSVGSPQLDAAIARVMQHYGELDIPACRVMSGVDIRDVVIDERGQAFFMDPGELRDVPIYQPLADFLGTLRNMHRFTVAVPSRRTIAACEAALLNGFLPRSMATRSCCWPSDCSACRRPCDGLTRNSIGVGSRAGFGNWFAGCTCSHRITAKSGSCLLIWSDGKERHENATVVCTAKAWQHFGRIHQSPKDLGMCGNPVPGTQAEAQEAAPGAAMAAAVSLPGCDGAEISLCAGR